jgi:serine/threonine protein kinase
MVTITDKFNYKGLDKYITGKNKTKLKVGEISFVVDKNYKIIEKLGKGAYGQVVKAKDLQEKEEELQDCAIKKIEEIFEHAVYAKRCLRELKILRLLEHENVRVLKKYI